MEAEVVPIADLKPHPRNYRIHGEEELKHIEASLKAHGIYRNVVIAKEGTILAGHGVVQAAERVGMTEIEVRRLDLNPDEPRALKVLIGDNEMARQAEVDDRLMTDMLKEIVVDDLEDLVGTGFDEAMLAALVYVTRMPDEIATKQAADEWIGMPSYDGEPTHATAAELQVIVSFRCEEDRQEFAQTFGLELTEKTRGIWWPPKEREKQADRIFEEGEAP